MAAGGVPVARPDHAEAVAELALDMRQELEQFNQKYSTSIRIRIGINTGPLVAGVIGRKKFAYDVWGDTVNVASRLESLADPGAIHVAETTYERLKRRYRFEGKHAVDIRGRSRSLAYWLGERLTLNR